MKRENSRDEGLPSGIVYTYCKTHGDREIGQGAGELALSVPI